jgi:hypothetical protein
MRLPAAALVKAVDSFLGRISRQAWERMDCDALCSESSSDRRLQLHLNGGKIQGQRKGSPGRFSTKALRKTRVKHA